MADGPVLSTPSHRDEPTRRRLGVVVGGTVFAFIVLVQAELYLRYIAPDLGAEVSRGAFLAALPFLQWQSFLATSLLGLLTWKATRRRGGAMVAWFLASLTMVLVAFDQLVFKRFHDHMTLSQTDGGVLDLGVAIPRLLGSAGSDADWMTYVNFSLLVLLVPMFWRLLVRPAPTMTRPAPRAVTLWFGLGAYLALAIPVLRNVRDRHELDRFPLLGLLWSEPDAVAIPRTVVSRGDELRRLRDRDWRGDSVEDAAMLARAASIRDAHRTHVIFIVMESTGALQLMPGGAFDRTVTPNLARLADDGLVFPQVYGVYPATTRAHVPIMSGGRAITWGSVGDELVLKSSAPSMVSVLRGAGYRTGLFAAPDLRFGYLREFYRTMPWDTVVHYQDGTPTLTKDQEIHSWGVNEDAVRPSVQQWLERAPSGAREFIEFHTIATHHPYGTWDGDRGPATGEDDHSRYRNSLHYVDAALGRLFADLETRGILQHSLVVVTGDHGEAFAEWHVDNWVHRNRLYEENVRNFMLVAAPGLGGKAVVSQRLGQHGDLLPTMTSLLGLPAPEVPGQDLTSTAYRPRIAYFHKDARPAQFGLRDGKWKYIAHLDGRQPELYDLLKDPTEQMNLATRHADRVRTYRDLAADWYVWANYDFARFLIGYDTTKRRTVTRANYARIEPPELRVGHFTRGEGGGFVETPVMGPNDPLFIWNRWAFLPEDIDVRIRVVSPRRAVHEFDFHILADWEISWYRPALDRAKEEGVWEVSIWHRGDRLATERFEVRRGAVPALRDAP